MCSLSKNAGSSCDELNVCDTDSNLKCIEGTDNTKKCKTIISYNGNCAAENTICNEEGNLECVSGSCQCKSGFSYKESKCMKQEEEGKPTEEETDETTNGKPTEEETDETSNGKPTEEETDETSNGSTTEETKEPKPTSDGNDESEGCKYLSMKFLIFLIFIYCINF